ncbi:MSH3 [Candida jiufengensis]|uniref:MSH3 n=1 Tax=Candida jiufengensis TaxID=497108 RepID=UPI002223F5F3|nr:MSH3 [Candida jiufengensis]KAI5952522.1 MSH3 [Candida jiufengensis]
MTPKKKQSSISHFFTPQKPKSPTQQQPPKVSPENSTNNGIEKFKFINLKSSNTLNTPESEVENNVEEVSKPIYQPTAQPIEPEQITTPPKEPPTNTSTSMDHFQFTNSKEDQIIPQKRTTEYTYTSRKVAKPTPKKKLTPLENQILEITSQHPDKILLIQVGYKYKIFGEKSAQHVSRVLNIMYIENKEDLRFSYCSFPDNRLHINLQRILNSNVKVGIVKQMESAIIKEIDKVGKSGDLMKREVTGVYTKGTYMSDEFIGSNLIPNSIEEENPNYIICINEINEKDFAVVAVQPLTGEIIYDEFHDLINRDELETRLLYLRPSEVIVLNNDSKINSSTLKCLKLINHDLKIEHKSKSQNMKKLNTYLNDEMLNYYITHYSLSIQECILHLIEYLSEFKLNNIFTIPQNISTFKDSRKYMILPANTLTALEIFVNTTEPNSNRGTLCWLLNHTKTRFGNRLLNKWISRPLIDKEQIQQRLNSVEELCKFNHIIDSLSQQLVKIGKNLDLEELLIKIHYSATTHSTRINRKQIFLMLQSFNDVLKLVKSFEKTITDSNFEIKSNILREMLKDLLKLSKTDVIYNLISMINPSYLLNESKDPFVQKTTFFNLNSNGEGFEDIKKEFENLKNIESEFEKELTKIRVLLQRPQLQYVTAQREPYLIEIRNGPLVSNLSSDFIKINSTKTVSRFRNKQIIQLIKLKSYHEEMLIQKCDLSFLQFCQILDCQYSFLSIIVKHLSTLDCLLSLSYYSNNNLKTKPDLVDDLIIDVKQARHPIIEQLKNDSSYVSNDINISYDTNRALIITGPNMGGKSSYVKTIALFTIMCQIGCYLPCSIAKMGIFDSIFIRMGASDNILKGKSTFMIEMSECSQIINRLTNRSLVILDEIGRGTGTTDGISLAFAILKYLIEIDYKPLILFITHYPSLHTIEDEYPGEVINYHMGFEEIQTPNQNFPEIIFLYNLVRGVINNSYGLNVAKLAGIPNDVISNAFKISEELKKQIEVSTDDKNYNFLKGVKNLLSGEINEESINNLLNI